MAGLLCHDVVYTVTIVLHCNLELNDMNINEIWIKTFANKFRKCCLPWTTCLQRHVLIYNTPCQLKIYNRTYFMWLYTETEMSSFWWNFHHWLHWKLSKWQLPVQPVMKISSKWRHFRFSVESFLWDVITHPCPYINGGLAKPSLKLCHVWVITSNRKPRLKLYIQIHITMTSYWAR